MRWQALFLAKQSNQADEYEDAFAADAEVGRFALADGASESSFAGRWAQLLVDEFVRTPLLSSLHWTEWLASVRGQWAGSADTQPLPWYAEAKAELGAFATLLGVMILDGRWRAVAVGDTCLFQVRGGGLIECFPLTAADAFGSNPNLIGSRTPTAEMLSQRQVWGRGSWQAGDTLLLMTDALAQWFLRAVEDGEQPWLEIDAVLAAPDVNQRFVEWIETLRQQASLRNDDVTLMAIHAEPGDAP
jgi:hypothetical protein